MQSITYQFDWLVDHSVYAKNDGSVEVVAIGQLAGDATGTGSLPVIASNTEKYLSTMRALKVLRCSSLK